MRILVIVIFSLMSSISYSQILTGKWKISSILGEQEKKEYVLTKPEEKTSYGNYLILHENGTFTSQELAPCLNQRFFKTNGTYELIDKNHIRFILKQYSIGGIGVTHEDEIVDRDLGLFYIDRNIDSTKLTKTE